MRSSFAVVPATLVLVLCACTSDDVAPTSFIAEFQGVGAATNPTATLSGGEEVPANTSRARGQAVLQLNADGDALTFRLLIANIENVTQSHIHRAAAGVNGPIVVWLRPAAPPAVLVPGRFDGLFAEGTITAANLVGPLAGQPLSALLAEMRAGNTYVNVHTSALQPGEIRGQIRANGPDF
jgi:hypothetical protein